MDTDLGVAQPQPRQQNTHDDSQHSQEQGSLVTVGISYLWSHEHMGQAELSCVSGCECTSVTIDAHSALVKHSISMVADLVLTRQGAPLDDIRQRQANRLALMSNNGQPEGEGTLPSTAGSARLPAEAAPVEMAPAHGGMTSGGVREGCVLRVEVLDATQSGEHKFKVIQVSVKAWMDASMVWNTTSHQPHESKRCMLEPSNRRF